MSEIKTTDQSFGIYSPLSRDVGDNVAEIVCAYVSHNPLPATELPALIRSVEAALTKTSSEPQAAAEPPVPAVSVKKSVTHEAIISLEDGKPYKTLKRHLSKLGLTPEGYRAKWGLPGDYPMVAKSYSEKRSGLAKALGLGRRFAPAPEPVAAPVARGRKKASV